MITAHKPTSDTPLPCGVNVTDELERDCEELKAAVKAVLDHVHMGDATLVTHVYEELAARGLSSDSAFTVRQITHELRNAYALRSKKMRSKVVKDREGYVCMCPKIRYDLLRNVPCPDNSVCVASQMFFFVAMKDGKRCVDLMSVYLNALYLKETDNVLLKQKNNRFISDLALVNKTSRFYSKELESSQKMLATTMKDAEITKSEFNNLLINSIVHDIVDAAMSKCVPQFLPIPIPVPLPIPFQSSSIELLMKRRDMSRRIQELEMRCENTMKRLKKQAEAMKKIQVRADATIANQKATINKLREQCRATMKLWLG